MEDKEIIELLDTLTDSIGQYNEMLDQIDNRGKQSRTHIPNGTTRVTNAATGESHVKINGKFVKEVRE